MRPGHSGGSGSEAQASVQNSCPAQQGLWALPGKQAHRARQVLQIFLLGQGVCSGQRVPRGRPAR